MPNKTLQVLLKKILNDTSETTIHFQTRAKDVILSDDENDTLDKYVAKLKGNVTGNINVEESTNGNIKVNNRDIVVYRHPLISELTPGSYLSVNVNNEGHVTGGASLPQEGFTTKLVNHKYNNPTINKDQLINTENNNTTNDVLNFLIKAISEIGSVANLNDISYDNLSQQLKNIIDNKLNKSALSISYEKDITVEGHVADARCIKDLYDYINNSLSNRIKVYLSEETTPSLVCKTETRAGIINIFNVNMNLTTHRDVKDSKYNIPVVSEYIVIAIPWIYTDTSMNINYDEKQIWYDLKTGSIITRTHIVGSDTLSTNYGNGMIINNPIQIGKATEIPGRNNIKQYIIKDSDLEGRLMITLVCTSTSSNPSLPKIVSHGVIPICALEAYNDGAIYGMDLFQHQRYGFHCNIKYFPELKAYRINIITTFTNSNTGANDPSYSPQLTIYIN